MKVILNIILILALILFSVSTVFAHFGVIIPSDDIISKKDDKKINFQIKFIHPFEGEYMQHVDWELDVRDPYYRPKKGERIFVNLTLCEAREFRRKYVENWWDKDMGDFGKMKDIYSDKEKIIEKLAISDYKSFGAGTTHLIIVEEDW